MVSWQGSGVGRDDRADSRYRLGLTRRVQIGVSVPRVSGGLGTTFFSAKIAAFDRHRFKLALSPTFEVLSQAHVAGSTDSMGLP